MACECIGLIRVLVIELTLKPNAKDCFSTALYHIFECKDGNRTFLFAPGVCQILRTSTEQQPDLLGTAWSLCAKSRIGNF
jgi:hypothetical protein